MSCCSSRRTSSNCLQRLWRDHRRSGHDPRYLDVRNAPGWRPYFSKWPCRSITSSADGIGRPLRSHSLANRTLFNLVILVLVLLVSEPVTPRWAKGMHCSSAVRRCTANQSLTGRTCHAFPADAHLPIAHGAPGANIVQSAMSPSTSMFALRLVRG